MTNWLLLSHPPSCFCHSHSSSGLSNIVFKTNCLSESRCIELMTPNWVGNWTEKHHLLQISSVSLTVLWFNRINNERHCVSAYVGVWLRNITLAANRVWRVDLFQLLSFFSHCGGVWKGDFPSKPNPGGLVKTWAAAADVMITVHHYKQITNSVALPACPFAHYTWLHGVTVNNYLALFFIKAFIHHPDGRDHVAFSNIAPRLR